MGTVHEFKRPGESRLHRFEAGFVNLGFLRNAAQSILSGWRTHALFEDVLPEEVRVRVDQSVRRHVKGVQRVLIDPESWTVTFWTRSPCGRGYSYSFDIGHTS